MSRLPSVGPDTVRGRRLSGQPGETIAALGQLPASVIRNW